MFVTDLFESTKFQVKVVYPGRFQPFHKGHAAVYQHLVKQYGIDNVFIVTSDKTDNDKSPFSFEEKKRMMVLTGIDPSKVVQSTQPYRAMEIVSKFDPASTVLLFAVSEKDMAEDPRFQFAPKKDGSPSYFQPFKDISACQPLAKHAYMITVPTFNFTVLGKPANSASQIRAQFATSDEQTQKKIVADLFGKFDPTVYNIMRTKLSSQPVTEASAHKKEVERKRKEYEKEQDVKRSKEGETFHSGNAKVTKPPVEEGWKGHPADSKPAITQQVDDTQNPDPKIQQLAKAVVKMKQKLSQLNGSVKESKDESLKARAKDLAPKVAAKYGANGKKGDPIKANDSLKAIAKSKLPVKESMIKESYNDAEYFDRWEDWKQNVKKLGGSTEHDGGGRYSAIDMIGERVGTWDENTGEGWLDFSGDHAYMGANDSLGEEQVNEISPALRDRYVMRAVSAHGGHNMARRNTTPGTPDHEYFARKERNNKIGINRALSDKRTGRNVEEAVGVTPKYFSTPKGDLVKMGGVSYLYAKETGRWYSRRNDYKAGAEAVPKWMPAQNVPSVVSNAIPNKDWDNEVDESAASGLGLKKYGVRYKVFAGKEGRVTTKEYWCKTAAQLERAVDKIQELGNFYEIDGYSYPPDAEPVEEGKFTVNAKTGAKLHPKTGAEIPGSIKPPAPPRSPVMQRRDSNGFTKEDYGTIWRKIEEVVGNIFPDGDPIDWLAPWLARSGIRDYHVGEVLDKACRMNGFKDIYAYYDSFKSEDYGYNESVAEGRFVKGPGGVPLDRRGNPKAGTKSPVAKQSAPASGPKVTVGAYHPPRKSEEPGFGSKHIGSGSGRGTTKGKVSGLGANTGKANSKPVVTAGKESSGEQINELSNDTVQSYANKAKRDYNSMNAWGNDEGMGPYSERKKTDPDHWSTKRQGNRVAGLKQAKARGVTPGHKTGGSYVSTGDQMRSDSRGGMGSKAFEGAEQVNELSVATLKRYIPAANKSRTDATKDAMQSGDWDPKTVDKMDNRADKTMAAVRKIQGKLSESDTGKIITRMHDGARNGDIKAVTECVKELKPYSKSLNESTKESIAKALRVVKRNAK